MTNYIQWYGSWLVMIATAFLIAGEVFIWWRRLMPSLQPMMFISLITLCLIYGVWSGVLVGVSVFGSVEWQVTVRDFNWLSLQRMYLSTSVPVFVWLIMRVVNFRAKRTSVEEKEQIREVGEILILSRESRKAAQAAQQEAYAYIHNT